MTDTPTAAAIPTASPKPATFETITLAEPIVRGETTIETLQLRKPKAGELRGLTLSDVIGLDIGTILKLLPRISEPVLTDDECSQLDVADLTECGGTIRGFFMTAAERQWMEKMLAEQQPTT